MKTAFLSMPLMQSRVYVFSDEELGYPRNVVVAPPFVPEKEPVLLGRWLPGTPNPHRELVGLMSLELLALSRVEPDDSPGEVDQVTVSTPAHAAPVSKVAHPMPEVEIVPETVPFAIATGGPPAAGLAVQRLRVRFTVAVNDVGVESFRAGLNVTEPRRPEQLAVYLVAATVVLALDGALNTTTGTTTAAANMIIRVLRSNIRSFPQDR